MTPRHGLLRPAAAVLAVLFAAAAAFAQGTVYNSVPSPLVPNYVSLGFQATQTAEFGDFVHLGGTTRALNTVTITMSNWALQSTPGNVTYCANNPSLCDSTGFLHPFKLTIYNIGAGTAGTRGVGSPIATVTQVKRVPWRPAADPTCPGGTAWRSPSDNACYNGYAFNMSFDMSGLGVVLPNDVVVGIAYNTQTYGAAPLGVDGPFNSLNVSIAGNLTAGTDDNANNVFWNTSTASNYTDLGAAGVGVFREDTGWGSPSPWGTIPIQITTTQNLVVRPSAQLDWISTTATGGTLGFVADVTAPSGAGALHLTTIADNASRTEYTRSVNVPLSGLFQASYWSKTMSGPPAAGPSYALGVYLDGTPTSFTNFVFEPYWNNGGSVPQGIWQKWDVTTSSQLWSSRTVNGGGACVTTAGSGGPPFYSLAGIKAACPNAVVVSHSIYMGTYNPSFDTYVDLVNFNGTVYDMEPDPTALVVDLDGQASATDCSAADPAFITIQAGINAAAAGQIVKVCPGTYNEDVNVNKANLILQGSGVDVSTILGTKGDGTSTTVTVSAQGVTIDGFTVTRDGNNLADWNGLVNSNGFAVSGANFTLQNSKVTGNRNGIYIGQSANNAIIRRNYIDFNRTGIHLVDNTGALIEQNFVTNNWTMGILYREEAPLGTPDPTGIVVRNNNISGNWYSEVEFREPAGSALINLSGNYLGTTAPSRVITQSGEPGYAAQIPVAYGGAAVAPASHPTIAGPQSARIDYSPFLNSGVDTLPGTPGFQGNFANVTVNADSPQAFGSANNIQEGINVSSAGGSVTAFAGTYAGNVIVNKAISLFGSPTITGVLTTTVAGATIAPGMSPGIVNSGNLSLAAGSNLNVELLGTTPGTGHDQINVTGTVNITGANLNVVQFSGAPPASYTIINNDGSDAVTGTFNGLPEGALFVAFGNTFSISYVGGDSNDVVVTSTLTTCNAVSIPTAIPTLPGVQLDVPINTDDLTGRGALGYETTITYDPAVLTYVSVVQAGTLSSGLTILPNVVTPGTLSVTGYSTGSTPLAGSGTLIYIRFNVIGPINPTPSPVNFSSFMFNEGNPCSTTTNGSVLINSGTLSGSVTYINGVPSLPGVPNVTLSGVGSTNVATVTDGTGNYALGGFGAGAYTVTPSKPALPLGSSNTAISNTDATRVAQHTVGIVTLNANQIIAGDVTGNGTVSNLDATYISQWKVGIANPGSTGSWIFQTASKSYPGGFATSVSGENYNAILKGDVTGNWNPGEAPYFAKLPAGESKDAVSIDAPEMSASKGSLVTVPIATTNLASKGVTGYEFEITYDPDVLEASKVAADTAASISSGMSVAANSPEPGRLLVFVYGIHEMTGDGTLINLYFNVNGKVGSSSPIEIRNLTLNEGEIASRSKSGSVQVVESLDSGVLRGRVLDGFGRGISRAHIIATSSSGERYSAHTNTTGRFEISKLRLGETYTLTVNAKRYTFLPQSVSLTDNVMSIDLIAQ